MAKHGYDFVDIGEVFDGRLAVIRPDTPSNGIWRCFNLDEIEGLELDEGEWRTGGSHEQQNRCVTDVHIDANPRAKQRFDWKNMKIVPVLNVSAVPRREFPPASRGAGASRS